MKEVYRGVCGRKQCFWFGEARPSRAEAETDLESHQAAADLHRPVVGVRGAFKVACERGCGWESEHFSVPEAEAALAAHHSENEEHELRPAPECERIEEALSEHRRWHEARERARGG